MGFRVVQLNLLHIFQYCFLVSIERGPIAVLAEDFFLAVLGINALEPFPAVITGSFEELERVSFVEAKA